MVVVTPEKIQEFGSQGWWGELTVGELFIQTALRQSAAPAVVDPPNRAQISGDAPRRWTWGELLEHTGRLVALFHAEGLRKDDIIVMQMPNCVEMHAIYLACALTGVIVTPVPVQYRGHELAHVCGLTQARWVLTCGRVGTQELSQMWQSQRSQWPSIERVWALGQALPDGVEALQAAWAARPAWDAAQLRAHMQAIGLTAHDVLTVCWTSGTEAQPKGVPRNHNEWLIVGQSVSDAGDLQPGAHLLIPFPFVNMAGISTSLMAWLLCGGCLHQHHPFDLEVFIAQMRAQPMDYSVAAPAVLNHLLKQPERLLEGVDLSRLRRIGSGGGPLSAWLVEQMAERLGIDVVNYFGSNEGASLASSPRDVPNPTQRASLFPRIGVPGFTWSLSNSLKVRSRLVDVDTGEEITTAGRVGELRMAGPTIFSGYYKSPELTRRAFDEQGFYRTGDLFEIAGDQQQFYRYSGRHKDIVIRGGMNISSEEIENLALGHPAVRECAVIGKPDRVLGERVCLVAVLQPGQSLTLEGLRQHLVEQEQVALFKCPEELILIEELPRNPVGKILKRELRARLAEATTAS